MLHSLSIYGLLEEKLTIILAHYVCQYGEAAHYNPIIQQDEEDYSIEETDIPEVVDDDESSNSGSNTDRKDNEDAIPGVIPLNMDTDGPGSPDQIHVSWATERAAAAAEKKTGLQQFQTALRQKLIPNIWTSAGALDQWLSGRNRRQPCRKLATLDPVKVREWIGPDHFTSFTKKCPFVIWRQGERDIEFSLPDPNLRSLKHLKTDTSSPLHLSWGQ